ncbi:hypothetical protein B7463_g4650, partial [Scytalidium lignicola]
MTTPAQDVYETVNPSVGKVVKTFPLSSDAEVRSAINIAEKVFQGDWRHRSISERTQIVSRSAALLKQNAEQHAQLITLETGKLIDQARWEIGVSADILAYYAETAETFLKISKIPNEDAVVVTEPIGVILAIEPWNFPYYQLARVAGPQLMAENVVIVKPAPSTPQCATAFARLFDEAGAPAGVYTNLMCSIEQVNTLIDDFRVRGVTLTGSERAGASVAERAGKNLKKVVLELGGSDPFLVLEDADLEGTIDAAVAGRLMCTGQACAASKRFIVIGEERAEAFLKGLVRRLKGLEAGEPTDSKTTIGPVASQRGLELLLSQVKGAVDNGARIVAGGKRIQRPGFYVEPTIITGISRENPLFNQETFGPVFSIYATENDEKAIDLANATPFGLGASVYSGNDEHAQRVAQSLDCGMVFINTPIYTNAHMPWGGVKNSGFGRELGGELGILEFVNKKMIRTTVKSKI